MSANQNNVNNIYALFNTNLRQYIVDLIQMFDTNQNVSYKPLFKSCQVWFPFLHFLTFLEIFYQVDFQLEN